MCDQPNVAWIPEADELLKTWCQQGKQFSSLDFKIALRASPGKPIKVLQRDVSAFLRNRFQTGLFPYGYARKLSDNEMYFVYYHDGSLVDTNTKATTQNILGAVANPSARVFYLRNAKNERAICITAVYHPQEAGYVKTAVGVTVWDGKSKYNRVFAREVATTRAHKAMTKDFAAGKAPGWEYFTINAPLPKTDDEVVLELASRISRQRSLGVVVPGKLVRAVERKLSA